jgi:3-hydroxyisobutyrate dehydrogenase-like beta-hydroxyacid dehydrogenase
MSENLGRVGFIGAGQMGMPMVERLIGAGRVVTAYARRPEAREALTASGATAVASVQEAVADAEAVVACLFADAQLRELAVGPDGFVDAMRGGALLISHTTGSPATSGVLADHGAARGIRVVEAPVSRSAVDIAAGQVTVLLGGEPADLEAARSVVAAYGDPILTIGPLGSAMAVKLLNNALFAAQVQLAGEVERIAAGFGVDLATLAPAILASSGRSYAMDVAGRNGSLAMVVERAGHFLYKDVSVVDEVARELELDLGVLGYVNREGPLTFRPREEDR